MSCPPPATESVVFAPDGASIYYARNNKSGTLLYQHMLGTRNSQDKLIFGREFHGEELGPDDLFSADVTDDGRYLVVQIDRGVPARRVDIVFRDLTKPGSPFDILVWGLESRFSAIYAKGAWYVRTDYQAPKGTHSQGRSRHYARRVEDRRARGAGADRELLYRGRQNLRQAA